MTKVKNPQAAGKRFEFLIIGELLKEGIDVYVPIVDDRGIDAVLRKKNRSCRQKNFWKSPSKIELEKMLSKELFSLMEEIPKKTRNLLIRNLKNMWQ